MQHKVLMLDGTFPRHNFPHTLSRFTVFTSRLSLLCLVAVLGGCERRTATPRADTVMIQPENRPAAVPSSESASAWPAAAGAGLFVQGETREEAIVLFPEAAVGVTTSALNALQSQAAGVTLFGRGGAKLAAQLGPQPTQTDAECLVWPLRGVQSVGADTVWAVGFSNGQVAALPLDSVEVLSTRDSLALVAEASRLASSVTVPTPPALQGLRFSVHDIRRFEVSPGVAAIVAHLMRKVNQEASPQEEQTLLIAERDSGVTSGPYRLVYAERTHGLEETTITPEVIAGVYIAGRPTLVVARDGQEGVAYALLERTGPGRWRIRWTSRWTHCA